ncbi:DNA polymerase/3'-5' exonuclease PolX [Bacillus massiliigorillae]|uniref:DNA polymerase/3'-5' exonuclease PolX n=1 Tax=Bacillus massiliigorillae TaxID=1243664 RepID=UPI0003A23FA2|nr:DNA polymerase/3'-5' exonuclease PolX [Bacillus massiliigorillae]
MTMNKKDIIKLLEQIALYMELKGENPFKISAFRKAAASLENDQRSLKEIDDFTTMSGIGKGTAAVIQEYITTGQSETLQQLQAEVPEGLVPLLQIAGLGGKKIAKLYKELGITNREELMKACEEKKVSALAGFGAKSEEKILVALKEQGSGPERLPLSFVMPIASEIEAFLATIPEAVRYSRAGSLRRMRETVKDLDFIIATNEPNQVREKLLSISNVKNIIAAGDTKVSVTLQYQYDVSVDFRLVKPEEFITTLHHFTGSKDHNVRMRQLAKERGEKISEYGVENVETGEIQTFESEEAFFKHFGVPFIPPEAREDGTEVERYKPEELLVHGDIQGDLHMHSTWSDGAYSIEEMIEACRAKGYRYMAITDHSQYLKVANGLTEERLREQIQIIKEYNKKYDDILILSGIEMDILPDGTLDFDDELLKELDIVIASIHSSFSQSREVIMERLTTALRNPHVDIIAHPTGRLIGRRDGYDVDMDALIQLAKETNTALELNANPHRLDLSAENLKKAQEVGVKIMINTDAHNMEMLDHMSIGVSTAMKAQLARSTVLNSQNVEEVLTFLKRND